MKNSFLKLTVLTLLLVFISCSDDDDAITLESTTYTLSEIGDSGVSGTAVFTKIDDETTSITVTLEGTEDGDSHPMHIHFNDAATGGGIALTLQSVDGDTGLSLTEDITALDDDTAITYEGLIDFDGYINVHRSLEELAIIEAQGNIGSNVN